ncbi:hypothetical protein EPR50_G00238430 [Perca flavescens]|uniref:C2H2-type domain-containing protein n=1 Tax=Perca flavescens TaxID=8167 RepID=A0A484BZD5_PERFV|nr:hypothetical protein EPR50_G00238430 [Perca flavescens]
MAEEGSVYELEGLKKQLESLLTRYSSDELRANSELFCSDFCKLVEEYASRWQVPLPQLRILEISLCYFARACTFFPSNCDHVLHTLSSLALSLFELLLFFDQKDFHQEPLKQFTVTFQECHQLALGELQNVHLLQVERLVRGGGPWAVPALQAILSESNLPQSEVDGCITSEMPVFFELRVHYLLSCERVSEAMALAKCCARNPTAGQHLFFLQVYLTWLLKTSQHDRLHKEVADLNGKDAIHIICSLECEEKDELLLALSRAFLSQQLRRGDMYYLCDLVFVWSKLHSRLNTSKNALLGESHQLMLSATNVNSIFPFIRAILQELGEDGIQFCVELCANALGSCLPCDVITKSLIYKTIAGLLPNDLEVCRACALLVFFLERTVEAYKMVYLLYMLPDQEYHVEESPIRNHVRFETLQVLKKDLYFDPEFWNLIALRTNCLKLMSEKVVSGALEEIMEDKWILSYCTKEAASRLSTPVCQKGSKGTAAKKRHHKEDRHHKNDTDTVSKRLKVGPGKTRPNVDPTVKKKGNRGSSSAEPLRRSFWQLDRLQDSVAVRHGELKRTTRLSEKNPPKRRIRKPKWLLEDSGNLGENNVLPKIKKHGLKHQKHHGSSVVKRSETGELKNNAKHKPSVNSHLMARKNNGKHQKGFLLGPLKPAPPPQVILELSLPDNELMGTFTEDTLNRQRGLPQVLLYRPTVKVPAASQPVKTVQRKEVVLRARDAAMFVQQLHGYARLQKGKGNRLNVQGSVSTITRSSVQGSPPKEPHRKLCKKPAAEMKGGITSQTPAAEVTQSPALETVLQVQTKKPVSRKTFSGGELSQQSAAEMEATSVSKTLAATEASAEKLCEESAVEMKVTIASKAAKVTQSPGLDKVSKDQTVKDSSKTTTSAEDNSQMVVTDNIPPVSIMADISNIGSFDPASSQSQDVLRDGKQDLKSLSSQAETARNLVAQEKADIPEVLTTVGNNISEVDVPDVFHKLSKGYIPRQNDTSGGTMVITNTPTDQDSINNISALTLVTEMVTELAPVAVDLENHKLLAPEYSSSKESTAGIADVQGKEEGPQDIGPETPENSKLIESEESKLEYCCTFCNKVFKGSRVVAHAMFHYRKDECMFCRTMFKDDLLAMMHLSDHIEKLKRSKESAGNTQENWVSETKDIATPKTSAKAKTTNVSSGCCSSGRTRQSTDCLKLISLPDSTPSGSRKLRSNDKPVDCPSLHEKKQNVSKHLNNKTPVHKVNGHICKKKRLGRPRKDTLSSEAKQPLIKEELSQVRSNDEVENPRLQQKQDIEMGSSATSAQVDKKLGCLTEDKMKETKSVQVLKTAPKHIGKVVEEKNAEPQERVCCPVEGCAWITDLSKNRVALLYHALEDHCGEVKPLELAFRVANSKCSSCMRVMWSFDHFQHHVERHRLTPRHPCLHQGCTARFKTGMEMRRHARRHSPLQAVCCRPGCSQLFICLWALNLHEREHYASQPTKPDKNTNPQTGDKRDNTPGGKKQPDHRPQDATAATTVNKTASVKAAHKLRGEALHNSSPGKPVQAPSPSTVGSPLLKERNATKDSHVLKNLSNKDTSTQPTGPNLRLRQTLRKDKVTNTTASHKVISSSLLKHNIKVRHKLKKKQVKVNTKGPKRRGRPPKSKEAVHDENTTTGQNDQAVVEKTAPLASPTKVAETSNVSNESKEEEKSQPVQDVVTSTETSIDESKSKKSTIKQTKKKLVKQKGISHASMTANSLNQSVSTTSADKTHKLTADKMKKLHKVKKRSAPKENSSQTASSDSSKSKRNKVTNGKANAKIVKKRFPLKEPESISDVQQVEAKASAGVERSADEEGRAKTENTDSTQSRSGKSVSAVPANTSEKTQKVTKEEQSKKSHVKKEGRKEKSSRSAPSDSGKTNKKNKHINKKGDIKTLEERRPCKDASTASALKKRAKSESVDQRVEAKAAAIESSPDVEGKAKEGPTDTTHDSSGSLIPAAKSKKPHVTKNSDPSKANKKRKNVHKEGDPEIVRKKCKGQGASSAPRKPEQSKIQPLAEGKAEVAGSAAGEEGETSAETPQSTIGGSGYSVVTNGQATREDVESTVFKNALEEYSKRPFMRLPPTAYLDEKYITMPKRRKALSSFQSSPKSPPSPQQTHVTTARQRQRCANCFATFDGAEDLQSHLQLQKCSNIFGFDSDDEGNS